MRKVLCIILFGVILVLYSQSCKTSLDVSTKGHPLPLLSSYGFFTGNLHLLNPNQRVFSYQLKNELFSDYLSKSRFVFLPDDQAMTFDPYEVFSFPEGTVLIKHFIDEKTESSVPNIIETRLLILSDGIWYAYPYIWNEDQSDAVYKPTGALVSLRQDVEVPSSTFEHVIPNKNQCKSCHNQNDILKPIGPRAIHLDKLLYKDGKLVNQLTFFKEQSILVAYDSNKVDHYPYCFDENADLTLRAKAYLDINCAHCHREGGSGGTSGLVLSAHQPLDRIYGINKTPVATGKGSGGRPYTIVPGNPDASILPYRMQSTDPGAMMPELGRSVIHEEGVALIEKWIQKLDSTDIVINY